MDIDYEVYKQTVKASSEMSQLACNTLRESLIFKGVKFCDSNEEYAEARDIQVSSFIDHDCMDKLPLLISSMTDRMAETISQQTRTMAVFLRNVNVRVERETTMLSALYSELGVVIVWSMYERQDRKSMGVSISARVAESRLLC